MIAANDALRARFLGCIFGCAVGDALGAPFEGLWSQSIPDEESLIASFAEFEGYPRGQFTDDTQLSIATVQAILKSGEVIPADIARSIARLWKKQSVIGPGGACTRAALDFLDTGDWTRCGAPVGQAGNGTAMRTAVLGLFFLRHLERLPSLVADVSRITHQDPRSVAGGVAIAAAARMLAYGDAMSPRDFCEGIAQSVDAYEPTFAEMIRKLPLLLDESPSVAVSIIAWSGMAKLEFDKPIITPYVIPTVLSSLWCVLLHPDSWGGAVAHAIRLGGDVDTLGAIVGAIMGTKLGISAVPQHLVETVVDTERLRKLAIRYHSLVVRNAQRDE
jgi:ADP-ribosyl-[dinitrogen reductase] hydrolase